MTYDLHGTWDNDQWVSYDDAETFKIKLDYANNLCLGGSMAWAASTDDSLRTAASAFSKTTSRIALSLKATDKSAGIFSQCVWGACAESGKTKCDGPLSAAQYAKVLPSGTTGFNLRYDAEQIFARGGYFEYTLKALGVDSDFHAKENSLKAAIWGIYTNINADKKWIRCRRRRNCEAMDRVLPNFINVGNGLSLQGALNDWYHDHFATMSANLVTYVLRRTPDMLAFWQSTQGQNLHGASNAAAIVTALQDLEKNAATYLAIKTGFM
ncbi:hypothetical protein GGS20DRAFT_588043 [Poronia punctata]|nr:hypothetical protein GGS20DRAFT_588043 [Poronia punctata]